jgi:PAS domain-containing protein
MSTVAVQFLDQGFHRVLFNAMPIPVFVVDRDVNILDYNTAASSLVGQDRPAVVNHRAGEAVHCRHAAETPEGCGYSSFCLDCVLRNSVQAAFAGRATSRQPARLERVVPKSGGQTENVGLRVTCQPVNYEGHSFALLVLEGPSD